MPSLLFLHLLTLHILGVTAGTPSDFPCTWTTAPRSTPSQGWGDGPHVGNGNMGFMVGASPSTKEGGFTIYGTIHGFWSNSLYQNSSMPPLAEDSSSVTQQHSGQPTPVGFPLCPGPQCNITVGLTLLRVYVTSPQLDPSVFTATLDIAHAATTLTFSGPGGAKLTATLFVSATSQVSILEVRNTGSVTLTSLNVTAAVNGNVQNVPLESAFNREPPSLPFISLFKHANSPAAHSTFPIFGAAALNGGALGGGDGEGVTATYTQYFTSNEPQSSWVTGKKEDTLTQGVFTILTLPPGGKGASFAMSMAASSDPDVVKSFGGDPTAAVQAAVSAPTANSSTLKPLHDAWWDNFYSQSSVSLGGEAMTEAFWWACLYTLGSGTRAGFPTMDLWSPWRTTDYSFWRASPTLDYNAQISTILHFLLFRHSDRKSVV